MQDLGFPEGPTHSWEVDQRHQGDPGGHQERDAAERLFRLTRWASAWLLRAGFDVMVSVGGRAGSAAKGPDRTWAVEKKSNYWMKRAQRCSYSGGVPQPPAGIICPIFMPAQFPQPFP